MVLLLATFVWGWYGFENMPKRKDPNIPVRARLRNALGLAQAPSTWNNWSVGPSKAPSRLTPRACSPPG